MNVNFWGFVNPQQLIIVEVTLLDSAILKGDFAFQGRRQTKVNAALHLPDNNIRVNHLAAVNNTRHLVHPNSATVS